LLVCLQIKLSLIALLPSQTSSFKQEQRYVGMARDHHKGRTKYTVQCCFVSAVLARAHKHTHTHTHTHTQTHTHTHTHTHTMITLCSVSLCTRHWDLSSRLSSEPYT